MQTSLGSECRHGSLNGTQPGGGLGCSHPVQGPQSLQDSSRRGHRGDVTVLILLLIRKWTDHPCPSHNKPTGIPGRSAGEQLPWTHSERNPGLDVRNEEWPHTLHPSHPWQCFLERDSDKPHITWQVQARGSNPAQTVRRSCGSISTVHHS